jgi:hypothetical protein
MAKSKIVVPVLPTKEAQKGIKRTAKAILKLLPKKESR